ncbi:hypothetical protein AZE42_08238 [Rhizopogon vesiculosus]|uniref:Uncharacterized protein n=1 Tax=Rhizopogon vesiculosus TaxID=180088 RepID=A0A1J8PP48_9AGAM|nr:hypothetical protein AZE42_08238 [Rhizopogon vesiculosus]
MHFPLIECHLMGPNHVGGQASQNYGIETFPEENKVWIAFEAGRPCVCSANGTMRRGITMHASLWHFKVVIHEICQCIRVDALHSSARLLEASADRFGEVFHVPVQAIWFMCTKQSDYTLIFIVHHDPSLDRPVADEIAPQLVQSLRGTKLKAPVDASESEEHTNATDSGKDDEPLCMSLTEISCHMHIKGLNLVHEAGGEKVSGKNKQPQEHFHKSKDG